LSLVLWAPARGPPGGPCMMPKTITAAHRGDVSAQAGAENTIEAQLEAARSGFELEFDVAITSDTVPFLFHDDNMERLTGHKVDVKDTDWATVSTYQYLEKTNGIAYGKRFDIPTLADFLNTVCTQHPNVTLNMDVKSVRTSSENVDKIIDVIVASPCRAASEQDVWLVSMGYPWELAMMRTALLRTEKLEKAYTVFYMHPNTWPLGEFFWLKSRFWSFFVRHDVLNLHYQIYDEHWDLIKGYKDDGYCLGIYGGSRKSMAQHLDKVDYLVEDVPSGVVFGDPVQYKAVTYTYPVVIGVWVILLLMICASVLWLFKICYRRGSKEPSEPKKSSQSQQPVMTDACNPDAVGNPTHDENAIPQDSILSQRLADSSCCAAPA